jgi:hypothetical protein
MNTFLKKIFYFIFPIVVVLIGIELYFRNQDHPFKLKATYQKENLSEIENVFLGTSHTQNGINPEFFSKKTSNLGFAAQNIQLDSAVFFKVIPKMEKVKNVIIELDYHRLDEPIDKNYFRLPWYYIYYDIEVYPINFFNKISLYSSNTEFFNTNLWNSFKSTYKEKVVNKYGYVVKNYNDNFAPMKYDSLEIIKTASVRLKNRHTDISLKSRLSNKNRINQMINYCNQNNIKVYILSFPLFKTYRDLKIVEKDAFRKQFIDSLVKHSKVKLLNYESSTDFNLKDFSDDDHLNPKGAEKLSRKLDSVFKL